MTPQTHRDVALVVGILRHMRDRHGRDAALALAERMIVTATAILTHERGSTHARKLLAAAAEAMLH